jgi:tRNA A-37 threonylcarbamoyl transferase component Bud32/membrane-associated phospholipid phosphatase
LVLDYVEHQFTQWLADVRTDPLTTFFQNVQAIGSAEVIGVLRWTALLGALIFRRFRHALVFFGVILVTTGLATWLSLAIARQRPYDIEILGHWEGFAQPSRPVIDLAVAWLGVIYLLIPQGTWRQIAKWVAGAWVGLFAVGQVYLAVDRPTDALSGIVIGVTAAIVAFRILVPEESFPITYHRGRAAHLDVSGRRGEAITRALSDQLGLDVVSLKPFGLEGSAGSTPLKITLANGRILFGKVYARTHLRADRWYKLGRTLLYGRLEDETSFSTVRRLVQYEDYLLRLMQDAGLPTAAPYGFVEITPEREYLIVTEFFDGASEIGDAEVDEAVMDDALRLIRALWDAGLAHRDIKPANLLVQDGRVLLIDVAFAQVRPSPWRQAVDLANMMLVLALRSDAETVYGRATRLFSPDEISEAFAATRGLTLTSQLRAQMKADGRDLVGEFRDLAPYRPPIRIQRWTVRRLAMTLGVLLGGLIVITAVLGLLTGAQLL